MTTVIPDAFYRITLGWNGRDGSGPRANTFGLNYVVGAGDGPEYGDPAGMVELCEEIAGRVQDSGILGYLSGSTELVSVSASTSETTSTYFTGGGSAWNGDVSGVYPAAMSAVIRLLSATPGRPGKGRMFQVDIPILLPEDDTPAVVSSRLSSAARDRFRSVWIDFMGRLDDQLVGPGVVQAMNGVHILHSNPALAPSRATGMTVAERPGWIRGRLYD